MKHILIIAAIFAASIASAQTRAVLKNSNGGTITESLTIGSGKTLTIASGATINATGATITGFTASAAWGSITGTLSAQTDLNTALGLKLSAATAESTYAPLVAANMTNATIDSISFGQGGGGILILNTASGTSMEVASGLTLNITAPFGTAAFADYGTDEYQLLRWAANSNMQDPASIVTATALGALKRTTELPVNLGGTGGTTPEDGLNGLLPTQSGHSGEFLKTNGATHSWAEVTGGVTSITGTANEIAVTGTTTPTLSLPSALTFTGKTITGGTFSTPTLTTPRLASGGFIADANGNESIIFTTTASAVNELTLANAATGTNPTITASGGDTNIGETHTMKGTGSFTVRAGTTSGDAQQWLNSAGSVVASMRQDGTLTLGTYGLLTPGIYNSGGGFCAGTSLFGGANGLLLNAAAVGGPFGLVNAQTLSGAGAVNVTASVTKITTTGAAQTLTLADGADGQVKIIIHVVDGGSAVLTPTTKTGFSSLTFTNAGDTATLMFSTTIGWTIIAVNGTTITP